MILKYHTLMQHKDFTRGVLGLVSPIDPDQTVKLCGPVTLSGSNKCMFKVYDIFHSYYVKVKCDLDHS